MICCCLMKLLPLDTPRAATRCPDPTRVRSLDFVPGAHTDVIDTVADRALVERTMGEHGIDAVIHGGALHKPDIVRYPRQAFVDVNVTGTLNQIGRAHV